MSRSWLCRQESACAWDVEAGRWVTWWRVAVKERAEVLVDGCEEEA